MKIFTNVQETHELDVIYNQSVNYQLLRTLK